MKIKNIVKIITEKVDGKKFDVSKYISTENMLANFGGVALASSLPTTAVTSFSKGDILISNIRPYFKKIWFASFDGVCSNDVICLRSKNVNCLQKYLFYLLNTDKFISIFVASSKGTKMPRGDKQVLLNYDFFLPPLPVQQHIIKNSFITI